MRNGVKEKRWAFLFAMMLLMMQQARAQKTDSSTVVASNENPYKAAVPKKPGKHIYDVLLPGQKGLRPEILYNDEDRFYVGLSYTDFSRNWRPDTAGRWQNIYLHYSISQNAFSLGYKGIVQRLAGGWNLFADAVYDWEKWTNFYGLGNKTVQVTNDITYYRIRSRDAYAGLGLQHRIGRQSSFILTPFYQRLQILYNDNRYLSAVYPEGKTARTYEAKNFAGISGGLVLQRLNDLLLPTKGIIFSSGIIYTKNTGEPRAFGTYNADVKFYLPFFNRFVLVMENGVTAVRGKPEFYQLASIGGNELRGYRGERFWGQTAFHNNNELQYLFNSPLKIFKGKMGLTAFADQGRVWLDGETSHTWHRGYGGGVLLAYQNKLYASAQIGISNERTGFHFSFRKSL